MLIRRHSVLLFCLLCYRHRYTAATIYATVSEAVEQWNPPPQTLLLPHSSSQQRHHIESVPPGFQWLLFVIVNAKNALFRCSFCCTASLFLKQRGDDARHKSHSRLINVQHYTLQREALRHDGSRAPPFIFGMQPQSISLEAGEKWLLHWFNFPFNMLLNRFVVGGIYRENLVSFTMIKKDIQPLTIASPISSYKNIL